MKNYNNNGDRKRRDMQPKMIFFNYGCIHILDGLHVSCQLMIDFFKLADTRQSLCIIVIIIILLHFMNGYGFQAEIS